MAETEDTCASVYVADDDRGMRDSLSALFDARELPHRLFASGDELLSTIRPDDSGCILLDYYMPGLNGIETIKALREVGNSLPIIMITAHGDISLAVAAMKAGALDFIEKPWNKDELLAIIDRAMELDESKREVQQARSAAEEAIASFTPRERQVFDQLVTGAATKVIARELDLSPRTVEFYRKNVFEKAGVSGAAELVRVAFMAGALQP